MTDFYYFCKKFDMKITVSNATCVDVGIDNPVRKGEPKEDTDMSGRTYTFQPLYIDGQIHVHPNLFELIHNSKNENLLFKVISYIIRTVDVKHHQYNIDLNRNVLSDALEIYKDNISRCISFLVDNKVIIPIYKYVDTRNYIVSTDKYFINPYYICVNSWSKTNNDMIIAKRAANNTIEDLLKEYLKNNPNVVL